MSNEPILIKRRIVEETYAEIDDDTDEDTGTDGLDAPVGKAGDEPPPRTEETARRRR